MDFEKVKAPIKNKGTSRPDFDYLVGGLTLLICGLLMLGGIYAVSRPQQSLLQSAQTTEGTFLELIPTTAQKRFYDATIQFMATNGQIYTYHVIVSDDAGYQIGDKIEVLYDPIDPQRALIPDKLIKGNLMYVCLSMAGLFFTGIGLYCCLQAFMMPRSLRKAHPSD